MNGDDISVNEIETNDKVDSGSTGHTTVSVDLSPIKERLDYQNDLIVLGDIILFAILVFFAFKNSLRGFWK